MKAGTRKRVRRGQVISYAEALRAALNAAMQRDPAVFVMGIGVDDHRAVFGSTRGLRERFGRERVFDTPVAEAAMTGVAIGAALNGLKPVHVHIRNDFLYLAMDQLLNIAAKWRYMFGGRMNIPLVVRCVVGRSWGQGAQHSQSLQALFAHVPGIKVVMPTTPADAQGLLLGAIQDPDPVLMIEHRLLYDLVGEVPDPPRALPLGPAVLRRRGKHLTIVANSFAAVQALRAAAFLSGRGVEAEVLDPVCLAPLDRKSILDSVRRTGRLLCVDASWTTYGTTAEIAALCAEKALRSLKAPVRRLGFAPCTCPVSKPLERRFYPDARAIAAAALGMLGRDSRVIEAADFPSGFRGPF